MAYNKNRKEKAFNNMIDICKAFIQNPEEDLHSQINVSYRIGWREDGKT